MHTKKGIIMTNTSKALTTTSFNVFNASVSSLDKKSNGDAYGFDVAMLQVDKEIKEIFIDKKVKGLGFNLCNEKASSTISLFNTYLVAVKALNNELKRCKTIPTYDYIKGTKVVAVNTIESNMKNTFNDIEVVRVAILKDNFTTARNVFKSMFNIDLSSDTFDKMGYLIMTKSTNNSLGVFSQKGFSILFMALMIRAYELCGCSVENSCKLNLCHLLGKVREINKEGYDNLLTYNKPMLGFVKDIIDTFDMKRYQGDGFVLEKAQKAVAKKINKYFVVTPENISVDDIVKDIKLALKPKEKKSKKKTTPKKTTKKATTKKTTTPKKTETNK